MAESSNARPLFFGSNDEDTKPLFFGSDEGDTKPLFFGSDDGDGSHMNVDQQTGRAASPSKKRLFFASSDDENDEAQENIEDIVKRRASGGLIYTSNAPSSPSSKAASSPGPSSSIHSTSPPPPPPKTYDAKPSASKKRKITHKKPAPLPPMSEVAGFESAYLGTFLVPNAWSTCKGRGWVKAGEEIIVRRNDSDGTPGPSGKTSSTKGKVEKKSQGKQLKLTSMLKSKDKAPMQKVVKKIKVDNVVRFANSRGFEIGRLPQNVASWVSKLLDQGIITFKGSTMVDCAESLQTGAEMLVQLRVYLLAEAFRPHRPASSSDDARSMFNEGQETLDEQSLRERKTSLAHLFKAVSLSPRKPNAFLRSSKDDLDIPDTNSEKLQSVPRDKGKKRAFNDNAEEGDRPLDDENDEEVLSDGQLNMIYKKAQKNDISMSEMEPADTFTLTLRPYQKQALFWMHSLESGNNSARDANSMHPLWEEYAFPYEELADGIIDMTEEQKPFYMNPYSGEMSLTFPRAEKICRGGILADEMGMGKTIMVSGLLHTSNDPESRESLGTVGDSDERQSSKPKQLKLNATFRPVKESRTTPCVPCATLIVAPTSLMDQWFKELERSSRKGSLKLLVWHGNNRDDLDGILEGNGKTDVVITSYGVVGSEWAKHEASTGLGSPLFQVEWLRVVLDEAHNCKSRLSRSAKACCALKARRRWALTGTPIVNKLEDLYSLLKFLDFTPWSDYSFFRSFITLPFLNRDPKAVEIVQVILESVLLRREKSMRDRDGNRIVELPAKEVTIERLEFSPMERKIYDSMYLDAKKNFDRLSAKGLVGKNYTHILAMLLRLRRAVLHPSLVQVKEASDTENEKPKGDFDVTSLIANFTKGNSFENEKKSNAYVEGVISKLREADGQECPVCLDFMESPVLVPECLHKCCKSCVLAFLQTCNEKGDEGRCPICRRGPVEESQLMEVVRRKPAMPAEDFFTSHNERDSSPEVILRKNNFNSSTKLNALSEDLLRLRDQDPCFRAVVFSQFTSFLDLIEIVLKRDRFIFYRFDGEMNVKKKAAAVEEFTGPSRTGKVFIVSLKAGGVGLNLTAADHVYMMDCWWNAAIENQAIDRVHRIGQERTVYVKQFIISNTIEDRILKIQKRKTTIVKAALGGVGEEGESLENLKIMFGDDL